MVLGCIHPTEETGVDIAPRGFRKANCQSSQRRKRRVADAIGVVSICPGYSVPTKGFLLQVPPAVHLRALSEVLCQGVLRLEVNITDDGGV